MKIKNIEFEGWEANKDEFCIAYLEDGTNYQCCINEDGTIDESPQDAGATWGNCGDWNFNHFDLDEIQEIHEKLCKLVNV